MFKRLKRFVTVLAVAAIPVSVMAVEAAPASAANCSSITTSAFNDATANSNSAQVTFSGCVDVAAIKIWGGGGTGMYNMSIGPTWYAEHKLTRSSSNCPIQAVAPDDYTCSPIGGGTLSTASFYEQVPLSCYSGSSWYRPSIDYYLLSYASHVWSVLRGVYDTSGLSDVFLPNC